MTYKKIIFIFSAIGLLSEITVTMMFSRRYDFLSIYFCCRVIEYRGLIEILLFPGLFIADRFVLDLAKYISSLAYHHAAGLRHVGDWVVIVGYATTFISNLMYFGGIGALVLFLRRRSRRR
jgi:hypothetical protein